MQSRSSLQASAARVSNRAVTAARLKVQAARRRFGWLPIEERVRWLGTSSPRSASRGLVQRAAGLLRNADDWLCVIGGDGELRDLLHSDLARRGIPHRVASRLEEIERSDLEHLVCIVCAEAEPRPTYRLARALLADAQLAAIPFEYATGFDRSHKTMRALDEYADTMFASPVVLDDPSPYELYERSLAVFEQKCGLRDYLDLYQLLRTTLERDVPGDIAEFGSYKGHSGWLIASTLETLGSDRRVQLFDTFESFPEEAAGIDYFWSASHEVVFDEVREKLAGLPRVELVRGDFATTVPAALGPQVALAYVDCDSYRAVKHVATTVFDSRLSVGGAMVFEDYGHPALLGCRVAVHELFDGRRDCMRFFSPFSGLYIVVKLADAQPHP